ncbi:MAG: ATP-binding protein [Alsobacter sp.]
MTSMAQGRKVSIFVSSPSDVMAERERVDHVVARLNASLRGSVVLETVRWEQGYYRADSTFQAQIVDPASCQIVVAIFWQRLGTPLPPGFETMPDGRPYPSGTIYEMVKAVEACRRNPDGLPDVLVYRKVADAAVSITDRERYRLAHEQRELFLTFWDEWFLTPAGQFKAAYNTFESTDDFDGRLEAHLRQWLSDRNYLTTQVRRPVAVYGSPFRGLEAFAPEDEELLFGRERDVQRALLRLGRRFAAGPTALMLIGESGSGKSSFARAGLAPRILRGGLGQGVSTWRYAEMRPGADPFHNLAAALFGTGALPELAESDFPTPADLASLLAQGGSAAVRPIDRALDRARDRLASEGGGDVRLLLVIDQFEELVSESGRSSAAAAFSALLLALVQGRRVVIVSTMRSDAYGALARIPELVALKEASETLDLLSPGPGDIAEIVRRPAELAGLVFERDAATGRSLDEVILSEVEGGSALPLLEFVLSQLFDSMMRRIAESGASLHDAPADLLVLRLADYAALGGVKGAIGAAAEAAVGGLPSDAQGALRELLRRLVTASAPQAGPAFVLRDAEIRREALPPALHVLVDALVDARILVVGAAPNGRETLRFAHAAVLSNWPRAAGLLEADQRFFRIRSDVEAALAHWSRLKAQNPRDADAALLQPGVPLAEAEALLAEGGELPPDLQDYVRRSGLKARRRARLMTLAVAIFAATAVLAGAAAVLAVRAQRAADNNAVLADLKAREADANREQAVKRLHQMADQTEVFVLNTIQSLKNRPGVTGEAVGALLAEADRQLTEIAKIDPDDPYIRMVEGKAATILADNFLQLGRNREAQVASQRCLDAVIGVPPEKRSVAEAHVLGLCLTSASHVAQSEGDLAKAAYFAERAEQAAKALHDAFPGDPIYARNRAVTSIGLADIRMAEGNLSAAARSYEEALAVRRSLVAASPDDVQAREDLALSLDRVAKLALARRQGPEALMAADEEVTISRRLQDNDKGHVGRRINLVAALEKQALARDLAGDPAGAVAALEESVAERRALVAQDPTRRDLPTMLVRGLNMLGIQLAKAGRAGDAAEAYREAATLAREAAARNPIPETQRDLTIALNKLSGVERAAGHPDAALQAANESVSIAGALAARSDAPTARLDLAASYLALAEAGGEPGKSYASALAIYDELSQAGLLPAGLASLRDSLRAVVTASPAP